MPPGTAERLLPLLARVVPALGFPVWPPPGDPSPFLAEFSSLTSFSSLPLSVSLFSPPPVLFLFTPPAPHHHTQYITSLWGEVQEQRRGHPVSHRGRRAIVPWPLNVPNDGLVSELGKGCSQSSMAPNHRLVGLSGPGAVMDWCAGSSEPWLFSRLRPALLFLGMNQP